MLANTLTERGRLLLDQHRPADALAAFAEALAHDPYHYHAQFHRVTALLRLTLPDEAREAVETLLHQRPDDAYVLNLYGLVLRDQHRWEQAEAAHRAAIGQEPTEVTFQANLAVLLHHIHQHEAALACAEAGPSLEPNHEDCLIIRLLSLHKLGRLTAPTRQSAIDDLLRLHPDSAFAHAAVGWVLLETGQVSQARQRFGEALRLSPQYGWAIDGLTQGLRARNPVYRLAMGFGRYPVPVKLLIVGFCGVLILSYLAIFLLPDNHPISFAIGGLILLIAGGAVANRSLFDVIVCFDPAGRYLLSPPQRQASLWTFANYAVLVGCALLMVGMPRLLLLAVGSLLLLLFIKVAYNPAMGLSGHRRGVVLLMAQFATWLSGIGYLFTTLWPFVVYVLTALVVSFYMSHLQQHAVRKARTN